MLDLRFSFQGYAGYRLFSWWPYLLAFKAVYLKLSGATPACSTLNYWLSSTCQLQGQIDWHAFGLEADWSCVWSQADPQPCSIKQILPGCCVLITLPHFCANTPFGTLGGTTIVMAAHNNRDILMVPYEDLPNKDKDIISKAIEEFQNKCLLSYTKTRDNKIILEISIVESFDTWIVRYIRRWW